MKPIDFAKAAGIALLLLVLNVLLSIPVILFYAWFIDPGHPRALRQSCVANSAVVLAHHGHCPLLRCGLSIRKRRPRRNGLQFAAAFTAFYALIDAATVGFVGAFHIEFGLSMLAKLLASLGGAFLASRGIHKSPAAPP